MGQPPDPPIKESPPDTDSSDIPYLPSSIAEQRPGCRQLHFGGCASAILNVLTAGVLLVNRSGEVVLANNAATGLLRRPLQQLQETPIEELLAPMQMLLSCVDRADERVEFKRQMPDGEDVYLGITVSICDSLYHGGERWHLAVLFQDITRWKELHEQNKLLLQMSTVSELMPTMLHELKNPLASIGTTVQLLLEDLSDGHVRDELKAVLGEVRRMELTLQGIGLAGRDLRLRHPTQITPALEQAVRILSHQAEHRGVTIHHVMSDLPPLALSPSVLRAVIFNLVTNAIQACQPGDEITCRAALEDGHFVMTIEDTGMGMDQATLTRCRELFYTTKPRGSGIGLALCHKVSQEAGGDLHIDSVWRQGTRVTFRVPCEGQEFACR